MRSTAAEITVEGPSTTRLPPAEEAPHRGLSAYHCSTCVPVPTCSAQLSGCALRRLMQSTSSLTSADFVYVHTPLITGSDCEGAGEMFRVTTLDPENPPRNEDGTIDFSQDFFGKPTSLTVSGQLEGECMAMAFGKIYTFWPYLPCRKILYPPPRCRVLDDRAGDCLC